MGTVAPVQLTHIDNIIYLTGEPMGRYASCWTLWKGAGANGYIFGFNPVCNYAMCGSNISYYCY